LIVDFYAMISISQNSQLTVWVQSMKFST